jgi:alpha-L-rhamnosidase
MMKLCGWVLALFFLMAAAAQAAQVEQLRCDYFHDPIGIDDLQPQLSWVITSEQRGDKQIGYQILVASSPDLLAKDQGDLWDSGPVASEQSTYVPYGGKPLGSRMRCYWKVRVADKDGKLTAWSPDASWTMGLLKPEDWTAQWISASRWFMPPEARPPGLQIGPAGGWADIDLGASYVIDSIKLFPQDPAHFPSRFTILGADNLQFKNAKTLVDESMQDYALPGNGPQEFPVNGYSARFVRLWITGSPNNQGSVVRQMQVMSGGKNVALMKYARELGTEWNHGHAVFMVDGMPSQNDGGTCPPDACSTLAAPLLRKSFPITKEIERATLYVAALGMADVTVNGKKVGDEVLGPPFSDCFKRVYYVTHDITPLLARGENVLGVTLANGYFSTPGRGFGERNGGDGPPRVLAQAEIEYADGTKETIGSDQTWKWSTGEIVYNDLWDGYIEDRHLAKPGWDQPNYDDSSWRAAGPATPPVGKLMAPLGPPIRVLDEIRPDSVSGNSAHFNALSSGWPRIKVNGKAGQVIKITGECPDYNLPNLMFVLAQDGPTVIEPRFVVLTGPADLHVNGLNEPLSADAVTIEHTDADLPIASSFTCSNPWFNTIFAATLRTHRNYDYDVPADPSREKQGWTQDAQGFFDAAAYLTNVSSFYHRWWWDWADNQDDSGYTGSVSPLVNRQEYGWNSPWWSGVIVYTPWEHYQYYGNLRMLKEAYGPMKRYVDFLGRMAEAGYDGDTGNHWDDYPYLTINLNPEVAQKKWIVWNGAGDWMNADEPGNQHVVPTPMTTMPAWYYYATIISKTAALLGKLDDAKKYAEIADDVKDRFNSDFFHPETALYGNRPDIQTAEVLPVALGLVPQGEEKEAYQCLLNSIHARKDHIGTGFVATPWLLQILAFHRETALANKMVNQKDFPSWNTLIRNGVLKEGWEGGNAQMPSTGGSVGAWLFQSVLGIQPDPAGPGFKKFILAPQPDVASGLTSAAGYYDSNFGRITSSWKCAGGVFSLHAVVPANTTATFYIPTTAPDSVMESNGPAAKAPGVKFLGMNGTAAVYAVASGPYDFTSILPPEPGQP